VSPVRRSHLVRWISITALVVGGVVVGVVATLPPASYTEVYSPLLGKEAPSVKGPTLTGSTFDLSSLRGRWVLLDFFASWCGPCQQEGSSLAAFARQHPTGSGVSLVGVVFDDTTANARRFLAQTGGNWPAVVDPNGQIALDYGVRGPPEAFIISPEGVVVTHVDGAVTDAGFKSLLSEAEKDV
jgi:cytochrome c biogenesis protein CcmG/thiol:disulfide interchange protein DsbE